MKAKISLNERMGTTFPENQTNQQPRKMTCTHCLPQHISVPYPLFSQTLHPPSPNLSCRPRLHRHCPRQQTSPPMVLPWTCTLGAPNLHPLTYLTCKVLGKTVGTSCLAWVVWPLRERRSSPEVNLYDEI